LAVVSGERRFEAPPERVFELLTDPEVIAGAMPAIRSHRVIDADHWEAKVKPPFPFAPSLTIRFEVLDRRRPAHARRGARGAGARVSSTVDHCADGGRTTVMRWQTDVHLSGPLGHLAGPGLETVVRLQAERTLDAVDRAL
jgi:carbon monoxide dehydrogenase subunit G